MKNLFLLLIFGTSLLLHAQLITNPLTYDIQARKTPGSPGFPSSYSQWNVDISHAGSNDILIGGVFGPDPDEANDAVKIPDNPNQYYFNVYIPYRGAFNRSHSIGIDITKCYVGYVSEVGKQGIVTMDQWVTDDPRYPDAKHGVIQNQIFCYTVDGNHLKQTLLAKFLPGDKNAIYDKYLSPSKRTKVQLQPVTP
jgi:hypothetical protein